MSFKRLLAIGTIAVCTTVCWVILAGAINFRSNTSQAQLFEEVGRNWGPVLHQQRPIFYYEAPTQGMPVREILPLNSTISVKLSYDPKRKGLLWYRTYLADFHAEYVIKNPTPITQTVYVSYQFPSQEGRYDAFSLTFGEKAADRPPVNGVLRESVRLEAGQQTTLSIAYKAPGMNEWSYVFGDHARVQNMKFTMQTNFAAIDIPADAESPTSRVDNNGGWTLHWNYTDVLGAKAIAMAMPHVTNPGDVAGRMTLFAPISLLFFFSVLIMTAVRNRTDLHPMNYFFLAAGCFAFQLLFAYLVDLMPIRFAFLIAAGISLLLVNSYLWLAAGPRFAVISAVAQFGFMVLFSFSFFFEGLTGITITIGSVVTLALLMVFTARIKWAEALSSVRSPLPKAS